MTACTSEPRRTANARVNRSRRVAFATALVGVIAAISIGLADPGSPLTVTKVDTPDPVASGAQLTYTITIVNTGGAKVTNVVLSDQLNGVGGIGVPPQLVLTSTRGSCQQNVNLVTCNGGAIEGLGTWVVTIRGIVTAASGTTINNTVSVSGTKSAQNFTTTTTATTLVSGGGGSPLPDLTIAKTGPTSVVKSTPMTYTITVNNLGTANATNVKFSDTLPLGLSGVSHSTTSLFVCTNDELAPPFPGAPITVTCVGGAVNQGSNASIAINATAPPTTGTITNTAAVDPDNTIVEANELNNSSALVNTLVLDSSAGAQLTIDKTDTDAPGADFSDGAGPDPVMPGQVVTYKILATNASPFRADDVVVVDGTQGLEAATIQVNQVVTNGTVGTFGGCTITAPQARCSIRSLNPGGTLLMTVSGQVIASAGSTIINTATVTGNIKNQGTTSTDTERTTVRPSVDLTVTKADSPDPVCARSWPTTTLGGGSKPTPTVPPLLAAPVCLGGLTYTFVLGNSGINTANNVVLRDPLPAGLIFDHYVDTGGVFPAGGCTAAGSVVTCVGGTLGPASTKTISFVMVAPPGVGPISNTVTIDPSNAIFEADETNNTATEATQVATGVDLTIKKFDNGLNPITGVANPGFDPVATRGTEIYTILVDNIGPQDVTNIVVRDTLPANTILRSASGDHGFTCTQNGNVVDCIGGSLPGTESEFYGALGAQHATITIRLFAQSIVGTMHNEVRVDPDNLIPEINEGNNIATQDTTVDKGGASTNAFNELTILKTRVTPPDPVARNAVVTYTIEIKNDGTDPVTGITVRDFLPAGARYIQATGDHHFNCSEVSGHVDCVGGELPAAVLGPPVVPGGPATITLKMYAPDTPNVAPGEVYTNQAIVDPDNTIPEGNEFNNQSSADIRVEDGGNGAFNDLQIMKTSTDTTPGGLIDYTIKVWNSGSNPAQNVTVRDVLPAGTTFISATDGGGPGSAFTCNEAAQIVTCIGATIKENTSLATPRIINIQVTAPNQNTTLHNLAIVDPDNAIPEGGEQNNTSTADTQVQSVVNLSITKVGPPTSNQSQPGQYVIKVTNEKKSLTGAPLDNVQMHDPLPVGLIPLAVEIDPGNENTWACQITGNAINVVDCIGHLDAGQTVTITIDVFMTAETGKSLDNEACVDPNHLIEEADPGESDNCSTHTTVIVPKSPNLFVTKSGDPGLVTPGGDLTYTIGVQNVGDAKADGPLTLTDTLPNIAGVKSVEFVDATGTNGWTCSYDGTIHVTCHDGPAPGGGNGLDAGSAVTITMHVTVHTDVTNPLVNTATAAPATTSEPGAVSEAAAGHTADNTASVTTSVGGSGFDLVLSTLTDNPDPVNPGQPLTYTLVAVNGGTAEAQNVKVAITLPSAGVLFQHAEGTNGFNCGSPVANVVTCTGTMPGGGDTTITVALTVLLSLIPPADLALTATIDPPYAGHPNGDFAESQEGNNSATETTTVSGTTCANCVDLVASQLIAAPGYTGFGVTDQTFTAQVVNVGDVPTALDPMSDELLRFVVYANTGSFSIDTLTFSNPAFEPLCTTTPTGTPVTFVTVSCKGNLAPSEGLTITFHVTSVTGELVSYVWADPTDKITNSSTPPEFREDNNLIFTTVIRF